MSSSARIGVLVATVLVLVLAFVLLSPGDDEPASTTSAPAPAERATATTAITATTTVAAEPEKPATEKYTSVVVREGEPEDGVQTITVRNGDRVGLQVSSPDTSDEIHIHGYDLSKKLQAGGRVRFAFTANADGIFEVELEDAGVEIARIVVTPS